MTSKHPYLHCRLCGIRFRSDQVKEHERKCTYEENNSSNKRSVEKTKELFEPVSSKDSGVNELRDKYEYYNQDKKSPIYTEEKEINPHSNQESKDSPLNLASNAHNRENEDKRKVEINNKPHDQSKVETTSSYSKNSNRNSSGSTRSKAKTACESVSNKNEFEEERSRNTSENKSDNNIKTTKRSSHVKINDKSENSKTSSSNQEDKNHEKQEDGRRKRKSEGIRRGSSTTDEKREMASKPYPDDSEDQSGTKTPCPSEERLRISSKTDSEVEEVSDTLERLPEITESAETAYQKHLKALVPCTHCERTFRPDRLPIHERSCIERPKSRQYIVPEKDSETEN
ncbi:uncharacterized protein NPIL_660711 [Nephila pilipes]|uniref:C2HC/C3H-type domain-containing protein n=1 Tax=Nephila pilipes TaxID=299642 RepID=A0A8X6T6L5_NEPPI|nr:uncharacterized protein NPIL_660711 [Nephila pilipes]